MKPDQPTIEYHILNSPALPRRDAGEANRHW